MFLFHQFFLSTIDCFKVFSYNIVITIIQSRNLVYRIFNFDMYSFVIKIAILVNRAVLDEITMPAPGLINPIVEVPTAEALRTSISEIIKSIFFLFKDLYFFL